MSLMDIDRKIHIILRYIKICQNLTLCILTIFIIIVISDVFMYYNGC